MVKELDDSQNGRKTGVDHNIWCYYSNGAPRYWGRGEVPDSPAEFPSLVLAGLIPPEKFA